MLTGRAATRPKSIDDLIEPRLAARLDRFDLMSRKLLSGKLPGERRSKRRGRSVEFDDFRNYVAGDDLRHIDWNIYARLDKLFIKLFREEEDLALHIAVDCSASMDAGEPNKRIFAARTAMALGYIGLVKQNRVTVTLFGLPTESSSGGGGGGGSASSGVRRLAPMRGRTNLRRLSDLLLEGINADHRAAARRDPAAAFNAAMRSIASDRAGRGVMIVLSDFLVPGGCAKGLSYLGALSMQGAIDAFIVQTLAPGEIDPEREREAGLIGDLRLTDVETDKAAEVTITPASISAYRRRLRAYNDQLRADAASRGVACVQVPTDTPVDQLMLSTLRRGGVLG